MLINNYLTASCFYYTTLFIVILSVLLLLSKKEVNCETASGRPFRRYPEEGAVIIGGDSSMPVPAHENPPGGQGVEVEGSGIGGPDPVQAQANVCVCVLAFNKKV